MVYRADQRHAAPVVYVPMGKSGCAIPTIVGLLLGGGFAALGWAAGWMDSGYTGLVIAGAGALAFVTFFVLMVTLFGRGGKPQPGNIVLEGSVVAFPEIDERVDLGAPHVATVTADEQRTLISLTRPEGDVTAPAIDEVSRQQYKAMTSSIRLNLHDVPASRAHQVFELPAFVGPHPELSAGTDLDANDPRHRPLIDALLVALKRHRQNNARYRAFAALPWDQPAAPASPLLQDIELEPNTDPAEFFAALLQTPQGADRSNPHAIIAGAFADVRSWIDGQMGIGPDYLLVDTFSTPGRVLPGSDVHCYTLVPIGAGRSKTRRDVHQMVTGGATSRGSLYRAAVVIEAPMLAKPLWVVFSSIQVVQDADHEIDALVAFANR